MNRTIPRLLSEVDYLLSQKPTVFYVGWDGKKNLGDEVVKQAAMEAIGNASFYPAKHPSTLLKAVRPTLADIALLGGGTLINMPSYLPAFANPAFRKRATFGTGVADPLFWKEHSTLRDTQKEWIELLNSANFISVRGPISKCLLENWGLRRDIHVTGDPALLFCDESPATKPQRKILGVNAGSTRDILWGKSDKKVWHDLVSQLGTLGKEGWSFVFFSVTPNDRAFVDYAESKLSQYPVKRLPLEMSRETFLSESRKVDVFVGEKLHATILACCSYTPSIMLSYRPKCEDFMQSIGMENLMIRTDKIQSANLLQRVSDLYANADRFQQDLFHAISRMKLKIIDAGRCISQVALS